MSLVLIAEDEEAMLDIFAEVVEEMGHQALRARDGEEALLLARTHLPSLVISDYMMPRLTGIDLLRSMRAEPHLAKVPFLLLSAAQPKGRDEANAFLSKPLDLDEFEAAIQRVLCSWPVASTMQAPTLPVDHRKSNAKGTMREEMLNWVAHELKTPLSSARLNAQIVVRKLDQKDSDSARRYADTIVRQVDRMNGLVTSILDAARLDDGKMVLQRAPTDIVGLLSELIHDWRELQASVDFTLRTELPRLELFVDAERVRLILNNLLSNAVKYGGEARRVEVGLFTSPGMASIHVRDWGVGIAASELPSVFDRFHRTEAAEGQGHGLGLYIAAALARLHGGSLSVVSTIGVGATFTLRLPLSR